jgi:hypothetical protein
VIVCDEYKAKFVLTSEGDEDGEVVTVDEFDDATATGISMPRVAIPLQDDAWYTLDGRRLQGQPAQKGLYINGGRKVVVR